MSFDYHHNYFEIPRSLIIPLLMVIFGFNSLFAQSPGRITGFVIDEDTNDPLPWAYVMLEGTSQGTSTSPEGEFTIRQVAPGSYNLVVGYIGYSEKKVPINVISGETLEINVTIKSVAVQGEQLTITAQALGQAGAINEQLSSNTITNVVSAEKIQEIPDMNAAESVGRLSGISVVRSGGEGQKVTIRGLSPQYNVIMVNGVRMQSTDRNNRSVDLNMIAPNVLSGISVTKALTADMDADAVGGTVNLRVGKAKPGFHSNVTVQSGYASMAYNNEQKYGNYRLSGLITNRFLDEKLGLQVSGFTESNNRNSDVMTSGYRLNEENQSEDGIIPIYLSNVTIIDRVTDRNRAGGSFVMDYDFKNGSLIFNNFISRLNENQVVQNNYFSTDYDWRGYATDNEYTNTVINSALQGEFEFSNVVMNFSLSNSVSRQDNPNNQRMDIRPRSGGTQGLSSSTPELFNLSPDDFLNAVTVIPSGKIVTGTNSLMRDVEVIGRTAEMNLTFPINITEQITGEFKMGGKVESNSRNNNEEVLYADTDRGGMAGPFISLIKDRWPELGINPEDTYISDALVMDPNYDIQDYLSGNEGVNSDRFYNLISIDKMHYMQQLARENGYYLPDPLGSSQYDYDYTRNFQAFYFMSQLNIGKYITLQPGIRYEAYDYDYTADSTFVFGRLTTPGEIYYQSETVNNDTISAQNWFPQLQMQIKPTDWLDIRLAKTKSIIYPDYRAISPYLYFDTYSSPSLRLGNPGLKPSLADNYDIYVSVYENHIGLFTAGYFYKKMENFIVPITYVTKDASKIDNRINLPQNGDNTTIRTWTNLENTSKVKGIELEWQTNFWYLPSLLQGLVLSINYTHIQSETHYPNYYTKKTGNFPFYKYTTVDTTRSGRLINQPNDILNVTLGYDLGGFSGRISYQYTDNILRGVNSTYDELDSFTAPYRRLDFTARQKLPWIEGLQVYFNLNNITNTPDRQYLSTRNLLSSVEYYGRTAAFGVRYAF